jgi:pyridoxal phosphate enzyme (YggS family)
VAGLIHGIEADKVRANLAEVREEIAAAARRAGRDPGDVEIVAATKYVPVEEMGALAEAGVGVVGENRAQDLEAKRERYGDAFTWDFIGHLQSRKVKVVLPHVRLVHSVASDSVLRQLEAHGTPDTEVLVEVNVAGEASKEGIAPADLGAFIERSPVRIGGLMTMPPFAEDPESSRPHFAALRELAERHGLSRLSMGTTQDYAVAVEEGASLVRIGTRLYL